MFGKKIGVDESVTTDGREILTTVMGVCLKLEYCTVVRISSSETLVVIDGSSDVVSLDKLFLLLGAKRFSKSVGKYSASGAGAFNSKL